jgi:starch phosphorylase
MFDVQVKRIHAYKRQILNVMHVVHEYLALVEDGRAQAVPRTYLFAGKAAPGYVLAKAIIKLVHDVAHVIHGDPRVKDSMKVVFVPDYRVSLAQAIIPAADLSEQISTAGTEASGTGNMKLALNGAVTIGTLDGATIEMREDIGAENMFVFGLTADEVRASRGSYRPRDIYERDARVRRVVDALSSRMFCPGEPDRYTWLNRMLLDDGDEHLHLADLPSFLDAQDAAASAHLDAEAWTRMAILNVARMGRFSSDRSIREYARDVWRIAPCT